jgi:hypothetical protein
MLKPLIAAVAGMVASPVLAVTVTVNAASHTTSSAGVDTITVTAGHLFSVTASPTDLWSAGPLPRWSNANGLVGNLFATGSDDSGESAGTLIGAYFAPWTFGGHTAPYGALIGRIGTEYRTMGTSFLGPAWASGTLKLFYWDGGGQDNSDSIQVRVTSVPEPASWAMLIAGFGLVGAVCRRRGMATA